VSLLFSDLVTKSKLIHENETVEDFQKRYQKWTDDKIASQRNATEKWSVSKNKSW